MSRGSGWHHAQDVCERIRQAKLGERNPMWKGDNVGMTSLHEWVKNRKPKPLKCECCGENKPVDLANISQEYKRDLDDWEWLCRKCHMTKDSRMNNLVQFQKGKEINHPINIERRYANGRWEYLLSCTDCGKKRWIRRSRMISLEFSNRCYSCESKRRWLEKGHL
jgi:hypothetical protein